MKQRLSQRLISFAAAVLIVLNSFTPAVVPWSTIGRVHAQEASEESQTFQNDQTTPTLTPTPSVDPAEPASQSGQTDPQPTSTPTPSPTAKPTDEPTPTETQVEGASTEQTPSTSTPTVETGATEQGELSVTIVQNTKADTLDLASVDTSSAQLSTDKGDYAPTDTVVVTGSLLTPNQDYTLIISSSDPPAVTFTTQVTTDNQGVFIASYQLDGTYRPNYTADLTDALGAIVATTTFTDCDPEDPDCVDHAPPTDPSSFSSNPSAGSSTNDTTIEVSWPQPGEPGGASDGDSEVAGYSYIFNQIEFDTPDDEQDLDADQTQVTSEPLGDGDWWFHLRTVDTMGHWTATAHVGPFEIDTESPSSDIDYPEEEVHYNSDSWNGEITGTAEDSPSSGVQTVFVSIQRDSDGTFWDADDEDWVVGEEEEEEYLNQADFDGEEGTWSFGFDFIGPEGEDEGYTARSHAQDNAGNLENTNEVHFFFSDDITPPTSTINSPAEETFWNEPIEISGSSTDIPQTTVDFVKLFYRNSDSEDEWTEIPDSQQDNDDEIDPFEWSFLWTPPKDGVFDIKAEATDKVGNTELSPVVESVTYDVTNPDAPVATPGAGDYTSDQSVTLTSSDDTSGLASIYYTTDGSVPSNTNGTLYSSAISIGIDTTLKAIAYDNADNPSDVLTAVYGIAPVISVETSSSVTSTSTTITWTTDDPATSRVVYDTVSHSELGAAPNYGYSSSTIESDTTPKVTSHSVVISGLTSGTTYYFRTISHGSPEAVSSQKSFATTSPSSSGGDGGTGSSSSTGAAASAPVCSDTKPGSAPKLTSAVSGVNSVTLSWSEAVSPVTYYLVTYGTASGAQTYGNPNVGGAGTSSYTVNNLSGGTTYYFRVRAGNGCMPGDYSNELSASPRGESVTGVATGFTPGVLGASTEEKNAGTQVTPPPEKEAATGDMVGEKTKEGKGMGWILGVILGGIGAISVFFFVRRRREDNS